MTSREFSRALRSRHIAEHDAAGRVDELRLSYPAELFLAAIQATPPGRFERDGTYMIEGGGIIPPSQAGLVRWFEAEYPDEAERIRCEAETRESPDVSNGFLDLGSLAFEFPAAELPTFELASTPERIPRHERRRKGRSGA